VSTQTLARGSATRTANKLRRKERILACAGQIIAAQGYDALTLSHLARQAGVTIPTIHNLVGKKSEIFKNLVDEVISRIDEVLARQSETDPILAVQVFTEELISLYAKDEALYKAAFVAGEREKLFEQQSPNGIFMRSVKLALQVCQDAKDNGYLNGDIDTRILAEQLFGSQRLARHDWMHSYIDLQTYKNRILIGMFTVLSADANPAFKARLTSQIRFVM
jgi:AcrR family transcriptional regulator